MGDCRTIKEWLLETNELLYTFPCFGFDAIDHSLIPRITPTENDMNQSFSSFRQLAAEAVSLVTTAETKKQEGHEQGVCCLAVSKGFLYSGSFDSRIIKWDLKDPNRQQTNIFEGHSEAVYRVSIQDMWLLSVSRDKTLRVWNDVSGQTIAVLRAHTAPILSLSVEGRIAWTGSDDCSILQWEWQSGAQTQVYHGHTDGVTDLQPAGDRLYSCSFDSTVRMWEIKTGRCVRVCARYFYIQILAFSLS
jgi:WD40 repeat protein